MRKLATIQTIKSVLPIEGVDFLELVTFQDNGWQCVTKKNEFKPNDLSIYFEIDSLLPVMPQFEYLDTVGITEIQACGDGVSQVVNLHSSMKQEAIRL